MENIKLVPQLSGLTEYWLPIPGFSGYEVSNFGRVKSFRTARCHKPNINGRILKTTKSRGYPIVQLMVNKIRKCKSIHSLVMLAFVGEAKGLEIDHINRIKTDNRLSNLQYLTIPEHRKKDKKGVSINKGVNSGATNLTNEQVLKIYSLAHTANIKQKDIANQFNLSQTAVSSIKLGRAWSHITGHKKPM